MNKWVSMMLIVATAILLGGCAPKVGSERWCANMNDKAKGDWTANEATEYAKHCLFKSDEKE